MRLLLFFFLLTSLAAPAATRDQQIDLVPGWNAVWLEVQPTAADGTPARPEAVFTDPAVSSVARFLPARSSIQFLQDPGTESLGADFWLKWHRDSVVEKSTLTGITGNTGYLILNSTTGTVHLALTGTVSFPRYSWVPDSYNLFGVPVGATAPTFTEFFGPAAAHPLDRIFTLNNGHWVTVKPGDRLAKNAAYWVYAKGGSAWQGPLPLLFPDAGGAIDFGSDLTTAELTAGNLTPAPATLKLSRLVDGLLVLEDAVGGSGIVNFDIATDGSGQGTLASQSSVTLRVEATRGKPASQENLYQVSAILASGSQYYQYLPVRASLNPKEPPTTGQAGVTALPGLWVGDVILTEATSLVDGKVSVPVTPANPDGTDTAGPPRLEPVKRPLSYRVILHVDAAGQAQLLEHATIMSKKRASGDLPREFVIVVDDTQIPNYVGIEQRGGKLVGKRFDTAAYDLPRKEIPGVEKDSDKNFKSSTLKSEYLLALPLTGVLSPGGVVLTNTGTFVMDPWHRTNPWRHAYNPDHLKGFRITREMNFAVDAAGSPEAVRTAGFGSSTLSGVFQESVSGLMKSGDVHQSRGRFLLQRVSEVPSLILQ